MPTGGRFARQLAALAVLIVAAFAGNFFHLPVFLGVDLLFGSIFALIVAHLFGPAAGMATAALAGVYSFVLWHHWYALVIFTLEAGFVGWAARRRATAIPLADAVYWVVAGIPLVWIFYRYALGTGSEATVLVLLKQSTNGVVNALLASLLLVYTPIGRWAGRAEAPGPVRIQDGIFYVVAGTILVPSLLIMVLGARGEKSRLEARAVRELRVVAGALQDFVADSRQRELEAVSALATSADLYGVFRGADPAPTQRAAETIVRAVPDLHNAYVANAEGVALAFHPTINAKGEGTIGLDFSDRAYYRELVRTRAPVFSGVFLGRGGIFQPITTVSVPVVREGQLLGYALGAVNLAPLTETLKLRAERQGAHATLLDASGKVIVSTRADLEIGQVPPPDRVGRRDLGDGISHWMPEEANTPALTQWLRSRYVQELSTELAPWRLVVELPLQPMMAALQARYIYALALVLALTLAAVGMAPLLARRAAGPLARLAEATGRIRRDVRSPEEVSWPETRLSEVASLVADFRGMQGDLRAQMNAVHQANATLELKSSELERLYAEARQADRRKDEFLAMLGHELRNPLGAVSNALQLLRRLPPEETTRRLKALEVVERQVRHQVRLVDDLLDVSRIRRGAFSLDLRTLDLSSLVRDTAEDHRATLEAQSIELHLERPAGEIFVRGDPTRLAQVVSNLLHNAQKFTNPGGEVTVRLSDEEGTAELCVRDTGAGIAPELLPVLFEPFVQGEAQLDRSRGGLGLGLALVRGVVRLHGGEVRAESAGPGRGASFSIQLPLASAPERPAEAPAEVKSGGRLRILVVDDNLDIRESMRSLLELAGHEVEVASDGAEALKKAELLDPQVVLCDLGLPEMDGYAVASALRLHDPLRRLLLVAISGYGGEEHRRRSEAAGFDAHLTKPVELSQLEELFERARA